MRILLVSDLHYRLPQFDWLVAQVADHDLVVLAGDLLDVSSAVPLDAQVAVLSEVLRRVPDRHRIVVSSGNHDLTGPDAHDEQSAPWVAALQADGVLVDGFSGRVGDVFVSVCPWWDGPVGRARVAERLAADAAVATRPWIWVYHWPPDASPTCWTGRKHYGDADLAAWIAEHRPDAVLSGHVHNPPFLPAGAWADRVGATWVFNAGTQIGPVPPHVEIDLAARTAVWHSLIGDEVQDLDADPVTDRPSF